MPQSQPGSKNASWKGGAKRSSEGYMLILKPDHYRADVKGYVFEHILIAEKALGSRLPEGAVVHHVDEKSGQIDPLALVICPDENYHRLIHQRSRALAASGHADWRKCNVCKTYDATDNLRFSTTHAWHRECANKASRERYSRSEKA